MAGHKDHKEIGTVVGALAAAWVQPPEVRGATALLEVLGGGLGGMVGAALPDILEPATSSHHRKFFHAMIPAGVAAHNGAPRALSAQAALRQRAHNLMIEVNSESDPGRRFWLWAQAILCSMAAGAVVGVPVGYASHLFLDGMTPRGLPLIY